MTKLTLPVLKAPNERPDLCGPCGGICCRAGPGICDPADLGHPLEAKVRSLLATELYRIGELEHADGFFLFVSPATVKSVPGRAFDGSDYVPCKLLGDDGCRLRFAERPRECRDLEPRLELGGRLGCTTGNEPGAYALLWRPHQRLLRRLAREFGGRT